MIYVVGSSKNNFLPLDSARKQFLVDKEHDGDNIDFLNRYYCELTGQYYMWKHCKDDDIVGIEHYRRYFVDGRNLLGKPKIESLLSKHDIILNPFNHPGKRCTYDWFIANNKQDDMDKWLMLIKTVEPEFFPIMWNYMMSNKLYVCNMFVCRYDILDRWCKWLFPLLNKYDRTVGLGENNLRIDGYLSEHTLGAWALWQGLKIAEVAKRIV